MLKNCDSCGVQASSYALVLDPNGEGNVVRCKHCRQLSLPFKTKSGVVGP
jgi:predicted RNA-binding Zn-ribbon protein involved in translation (DUF1610 family)